MIQLIMAVVLYPSLAIIFFLLRDATRPKKNLILEVTLPYEGQRDEEVLALCKSFRRVLLAVFLALTAAMAPLFFLPSMGLFMTGILLWLDLAIICPYVVFAFWRGKLMKLKAARGWRAGGGQRLADLTVAARPVKRLSPLWFLPPLAASAVPVVASAAALSRSPDEVWMLAVYLVDLALIPLFFAFHRIIYRQASEAVDRDTDLTQALTQARRYQWSRFWLAAAWLTGAFNLGIWLLRDSALGFLVVTLVYCGVLLALCLATELAARRAQEALTRSTGQDYYVDTDDNWLWGLLYYNPNDSHLMINNRTGMGTSMNLARPAGMALAVLSGLIMAAMPLIGVWMLSLESTPVTLALEGEALVARHVGTEYAIPLEDIASAELVDTLEDARRVAGTAMDNALTGRFQVAGERCTLCLDPQSPPFLRVVLTSGEVYYLGDRDPGLTQALLAALSP